MNFNTKKAIISHWPKGPIITRTAVLDLLARAETAEQRADDTAHRVKNFALALATETQRTVAAERALRLVIARCRDPHASATENFERVAEEYYRETGGMVPGKDVPAAIGGSEEERRAKYDVWEKAKWLEAWSAAKAVVP